MRKVEIAPSFDRDAEAIGAFIEARFGAEVRRNFVADLEKICTLIALLPSIGNYGHGYNTKLSGFAFGRNWIFFDFDEESVSFLHIVPARHDRQSPWLE